MVFASARRKPTATSRASRVPRGIDGARGGCCVAVDREHHLNRGRAVVVASRSKRARRPRESVTPRAVRRSAIEEVLPFPSPGCSRWATGWEVTDDYTNLHRNILDVFNEYGVQIMTPAYEGDPAAPKVVPKEQWYTAPATPEGGSA